MRPVSRRRSRRGLVVGSTFRRTPIFRSPLEKNPMPGHLSELHPVNEVHTKGQFLRASFGKSPRFQIQLDKRWNSLSGRFPISSSFVWFDGHLSCSFTCWVFLCLYILFKLLSLGCPFCILAFCGVLFIVEFSHCGWGCTGGLSKFLG